MSGGELVLALILLVLAVGYFAVFLWAHFHKPKPPARPLAPLATTPLARYVLAAHKAAEHHDLAVLTGTAEQVENSLVNVISTSNELAGYLYQKEHARTEKKQ